MFKLCVILFLAVVSCEDAEKETQTETDTDAETGKSFLAYDFLYNEGVSLYLQENWEGCVKNLEKALKGWHWWNDSTARCRRNCSGEARQKELLSVYMSEEDRYYEQTLHNTLCLVRCKKEVFGAQRDRVVESNVINDFNTRKPYDYLQLCYYQLGRMKDAASAAATVIAVQPNNAVMADNLRYYLEEEGVEANEVVNMEVKPYGHEYVKATTAYKENNFDQTITHMEESLKLFLEEYYNCRFLCENPFDQGWYPDFVSSVANHFTFTLRCKRRCLWQLSDLYGEIDDNFLPSHFDYLQYSYFQKGETEKACEAVATYLVLNPDDETQMRNKEFYDTVEGVTQDMFVPRAEIVELRVREDYEHELMQFIETNFAFLTDDFWDEDETTEEKKVGESQSINTTTTTAAELDTSSVVLGTAEVLHEDL